MLVALVVAASMVGAYPMSLGEMLAAIGRRLSGAAPASQIDTVLFEVRLPRVFAAVVVGAAIAAAGAAYQTLFRNPLVSPDILGVSTGAAHRRARAALQADATVEVPRRRRGRDREPLLQSCRA